MNLQTAYDIAVIEAAKGAASNTAIPREGDRRACPRCRHVLLD